MKNSSIVRYGLSLLRNKAFLFSLFLLSVLHVSAQDITFDVLEYKGGYNISCYGATDGHIDATIAGGTAPYTYSWSNGATTQDLSGIGAGSYTLTVTDSLGGTDTKSVTLYQSDVLSTTLNPSVFGGGYNLNVHGNNSGSITTDITGGAPPYTYVWSTGATVSHINNRPAGTYTVTVTDQNGCTSTESTELTQPTALQVGISVSQHGSYNLTCGNGNDGAIDLTISGGVPPYYYDYGTGNGEDNQNSYLHNVGAGYYFVAISDDNGAFLDSTVILTAPPVYTVTLSASSYANGHNTGCYGCFDGSAEIAVNNGGTHPYTYAWSGGVTGNTITNIGAGTYTVTATDAHGCITTNNITLTDPAQNAWGKTGNAADSTEFMGTTNSTPMIFKTNGTERMRMLADGKIGIGTGNPQAKLDVNGDLRAEGAITFGGSQRLTYLPASAGAPARLGFGGLVSYPGPILNACFSPTVQTYNQFAGMIQAFGTNVDGDMTNVLNMGFDGANGIIDVAGTSNSGAPNLLMNYYCGKDIYMCTGSNGGFVGVGHNFELGNPTRNPNTAMNISAGDKTGLWLTTTQSADFGNNTILEVNRDSTKAFSIRKDNAENFIVYGNGKTMIGNASGMPQAKLDVIGNVRVGSMSGQGVNVVQVNNDGILQVMALDAAGVGFWNSTDGGNTIFHNTGNVGIGNNAPADLLDIGNGAARLISGNAGGSALNYGTSYIGFNASRNVSNGNWTFKTDTQHNGGAVMYANVFGDMYFSTTPNNAGTADQTKTDSVVYASTKLFIASDGNVAIGTIHPDGYKLSVNGTMRAKDITVKLTGWSDFVFDENYTRMSILEKEIYYKKEKHLPNINCGNEIVNNGLQVGTTMNGMMQNIEENTLDLADLYKKFLTLEKENAELKQQNIEIQQRVIELEKAQQ